METLDMQTVCYLIIKAREFDAKTEVEEPDPGSNPADEGMREVLQDYADDPVMEEMQSVIEDLNLDQQVELVALAWLGRGDYTKDDWKEVLGEAKDAHNDHTASYLLGMPLLGDYLEEGLSTLGFSCEDYEIGRL